jgi:hypothetical protein
MSPVILAIGFLIPHLTIVSRHRSGYAQSK